VARGREPGGTPATVALRRAGVSFTTHGYEPDPAHPSYGLEAAEALGLPPEQVLKTLLAEVDGVPTVAVVPVAARLDLKALAAASGGKRATLADAADAERLTGYVVGGISPLGQRRRLPTVVDASAVEHTVVYVSGGRRGFDVGLDPADLVRLTAAVVAPVARREPARPG
jgi:Cys-tRNA(Pro)/Cys-tRNA(Cys) deacylase